MMRAPRSANSIASSGQRSDAPELDHRDAGERSRAPSSGPSPHNAKNLGSAPVERWMRAQVRKRQARWSRRAVDLGPAPLGVDGRRVGRQGVAHVGELHDPGRRRRRIAERPEPPQREQRLAPALGVEPVGDTRILVRDDDADPAVVADAGLRVVEAGDARGVLQRLPPREVVEVEAPVAAVGDVAVDDQRLVGREVEEAERVVRRRRARAARRSRRRTRCRSGRRARRACTGSST